MDAVIPSVANSLELRELRGLVKICGLREPKHAAAAVEAGADLIGFVFAPARRYVPPEQARACIAAARAEALTGGITAVGVFVDAALEEIEAVVAASGIDAVQLHGAEPPDLLENLSVPAIKVFRPQPGQRADQVSAQMERYRVKGNALPWILLDGYAQGAAGGTGAQADWSVAAEIARQTPIFLGGGLDPENVAEAIRRVGPIGVDVSSGVEVEGVKDITRIRAFVAAAKGAFQR